MKPVIAGNDAPSSSKSERKEKVRTAPKALNTEALEQSLWLVKVPQFVAERWAKAESDDIVGSLSVSLISAGPNKPPTKQLNVQLNPTSGSSGPDKFTLDESKASTDSFIAVSSDSSKGFSVDGTITKNMVLKPVITDEYRQLIRERGLSNVANRKEIGVANMKEIERTSTQSHTVEFMTSDKIEMKRKAAAEKLSANKASRTSGGEDGDTLTQLRSRMFEAFEKTDRLTFKDILSYCSDVTGFTREQDLRDLLEEYGRYHHRGTYKHFWELKAEYKDNYTEAAKVDG